MFSTDDTIVAIATPPGRGGIGVVRLSGPQARAIGSALVGGLTLRSRHATFGHVIDAGPDGVEQRLDQVVATWFEAPHSYTTEDVVEISAHGSPLLLQRIVDLAIGRGARLAEPGEFTFRAYLHGRLDLVQAEAVADLIDAVTPLQARTAFDQLDGTLTGAIASFEATLFDLAARLEASLDFPEEGFHFVARTEVASMLAGLAARLRALLHDAEAGRVLREGSLVAIIGPPNAGKSSLFNALVGSARAIVADVPGTTRDVLSERVDLDGLAVTLIDTAGLRPPADDVEAEGVRRAGQARDVSTLVLVVIDRSAPFDAVTWNDLQTVPGRRLVVANKADRPPAWDPAAVASDAPVVAVSALTGAGLGDLRRQIRRLLIDRDDWRDPPAVSNQRHAHLIRDALVALERAGAAAEAGASEELVLVDVTVARDALETVTGRRSADDLLHHVFSRFCVGK